MKIKTESVTGKVPSLRDFHFGFGVVVLFLFLQAPVCAQSIDPQLGNLAGTAEGRFAMTPDGADALYFRHDLPGGNFRYRAGQVKISDIHGNCAYSCSEKKSFSSRPLSANPANTLPGKTIGFIGEFMISDIVVIEGAVADTAGDGEIDFGRPFKLGDWAYAVSLTLNDLIPDTGYGKYKVAFYSVDPMRQGTPEARSDGFSVIVEQDIGDVGLFARYGTSWGRGGAVDQTAAAGLVWKTFLNDEEGWLGFGLGWTSPTADEDTKVDDEYIAEAFYRLQLSPRAEIKAGAMAATHSSNIRSGASGTLNMRAKIKF